MKAITGTACHTFGELLQGQREGVPFLVSLPIESYVNATFYPATSGELMTSPQKVKVYRVLRRLMNECKISLHGTLLLEKTLPESKGFATSTADMVAACRAVSKAYKLCLLPQHISSLLVQIEPTDGIMYDEVVAYQHHHGRVITSLGYLPPLRIIGVDRGGKVDTVSFNKRLAVYTCQEEKEYDRLLQKLQEAFREGDSELIGYVATRSAEMHQKRLAHPDFEELKALCRKAGGLGVVVAHSGTLAGILLDASSSSCERKVNMLQKKMKGWPRTVYTFSVARSQKGIVV
ncbi:kinase [Aneurinibacillus thermoaerophilus]|uniref:GHMP family kinase ATP-binding protein n=1 Tax=Aneurinibacillus thermoaerophilus TaxID=143495 RepID=UPI002E2071BD|nr:kinase [Aneurinibacillus thermoaerophilus]MED0765846.1 kinase [Aneurinibacillus thermoaerophilus]